MSTKKERRTFSDEFKSQIVQLFNAGKSRSDICREYELAPAVVDGWIKRINATGSAVNFAVFIPLNKKSAHFIIVYVQTSL